MTMIYDLLTKFFFIMAISALILASLVYQPTLAMAANAPNPCNDPNNLCNNFNNFPIDCISLAGLTCPSNANDCHCIFPATTCQCPPPGSG